MWPPNKAELLELFKDGAELQTIADIYNAERSMVYDLAQRYGIEMMTPTQRKQARARMESEGRRFPTPETLDAFRERAHVSRSTKGQMAYAGNLQEKERAEQMQQVLRRQKHMRETALRLKSEKEKNESRLTLKKKRMLQEAFDTGVHKRLFTIEESTRHIERDEVKHWVEQSYSAEHIVYETGIDRTRLLNAFRKYGFETIDVFPYSDSLEVFEKKKRQRMLVAYDIEGIKEKAAEGYALWRIAKHFGYLEKKLEEVVEDFAIQVNSIEDDPFRHEVRKFFEGGKRLFSEGCHHFGIGAKRMTQLAKAYRIMTLRSNRKVYSKKRPPKALLEDLYNNQNMTRVQIGRQLNVSVADLTEWFDEYGMKTFKRGRNEPLREELYDLYINQRWSKNKMARYYNRSTCWLNKRLERHGIERVRYTRANPPPRELLYDLYMVQKLSQPVVAEIVNISVPQLSLVLRDYNI